MTSIESFAWRLAAIIEVPFEDRIQCQCKGCGHIVYKRIHLIDWTDGRIECWGQDCYARELGSTLQGRSAKPIYDLGGRRKLKPEERELLKSNREQLVAEFREEQEEKQRREQAERERQESLRLAIEKRRQSALCMAKLHERRPDISQISPISDPEYICEICGRKTNDWWYHKGKTDTCRCNNCKRQGKTQPVK